MTTRLFISQLLSAAILVTPVPAFAHHSHAPYDTSTTVTVEGTITEYVWRNPHVFVRLDRQLLDGSVVEVEVEADAAAALVPFGTNADSISVGEHVVINAHPHRRLGAESMLGREILKDDGTLVGLTVAYARQLVSSGSAVASGIEGTWLPEQGALFSFNDDWSVLPLTESALTAIEGYTIADAPAVTCTPHPAPISMMYPALNTVDVRDDVVRLRNDWLGDERVVYMDGRDHPENAERTIQGHSIGRWDGDVLVIDTIGFSDHRRGNLGPGVPSGVQKHLIERIGLDEDGTSITYTFTVEDPQYFTEPITYSFKWYYRPDMQPTRIDCDLEAAGRALVIEAL